MAELVTILSGCGGMGKSFFACNLACYLRKKQKKVLLVELSFGAVSHDIIMGTSPVTMYNIADALCGVCKPTEAVNTPDDESLPDFISASTLPCAAEPSFARFAESFGSYYDYIICDASSFGIAKESGTFDICGKVLYMTDDSPVSVRNTALGISHIKNISNSEVYLVLSKVIIGNEKEGISAEDIVDECLAPIIGIIPYDEYAPRSMREGKLAFRYDTFSSRAVSNITERILHNEISDFETGAVTRFFKRSKFNFK